MAPNYIRSASPTLNTSKVADPSLTQELANTSSMTNWAEVPSEQFTAAWMTTASAQWLSRC